MKTIHSVFGALLLASLTLVMGVSSCKKDAPVTQTQKTLRVLSSKHSFTAVGGSGVITLSQDGVAAKCESPWLQINQVEGSKVSYTVAPNTTPSTRTAQVLITKGGESQQISITQLGAYSYIDDLKPSYTTERSGGVIELPLIGDFLPSEVRVEGLPSWVSYKLEGKKLLFIIEATSVLRREAICTITLSSTYSKQVKLIQEYGPLGYRALLGTYKLSYIDTYQGSTKEAEVTLIEDRAKKGYILQGLAVDIHVELVEKTNTLIINPTELPKPQGITLSLILAAAAGGYPDATGKPSHSLSWGEEYSFSASWDAVSIEHPAFEFKPSEQAKAKGLHGLHFFLFGGGSYKGAYPGTTGIHTILDFSLTKK